MSFLLSVLGDLNLAVPRQRLQNRWIVLLWCSLPCPSELRSEVLGVLSSATYSIRFCEIAGAFPKLLYTVVWMIVC